MCCIYIRRSPWIRVPVVSPICFSIRCTASAATSTGVLASAVLAGTSNKFFQHKDSCKNAGTQQGNLNISADSCLSAAALPLGSDPALSDAGAVSIVFVNILLICIARMTLLLPPGLVFCCAVVEYCGCDFFLPPSCGIADMLCCDRSVRPPV